MNLQKISNLKYSNLVNNPKKSLTEISGRYLENAGSEKYIVKDIYKKLNLKTKSCSLLDIGCGHGKLTNLIVDLVLKKKIDLTLCDIKTIISKLKKKNKKKNINYIASEFQKYNFKKKIKFDRILMYSVIHYSNKPKNFIKKAFSILNKKGILLLGDIPNIDKKYRFLRSKFGKKFEKKNKIKRFDINKLTLNYNSFLKHTKQNLSINDKFIFWIKKYFSSKKAKVLIYNQPKKLPYSYTRLDILIKKNV